MAAGWLLDAAAVLGVAGLCGAWVAVQAWVARRDPCQPGVEGNCGCKGWKAAEAGGSSTCRRRGGAGSADPGELVHLPARN